MLDFMDQIVTEYHPVIFTIHLLRRLKHVLERVRVDSINQKLVEELLTAYVLHVLERVRVDNIKHKLAGELRTVYAHHVRSRQIINMFQQYVHLHKTHNLVQRIQQRVVVESFSRVSTRDLQVHLVLQGHAKHVLNQIKTSINTLQPRVLRQAIRKSAQQVVVLDQGTI
jgi:hypothetical protein